MPFNKETKQSLSIEDQCVIIDYRNAKMVSMFIEMLEWWVGL